MKLTILLILFIINDYVVIIFFNSCPHNLLSKYHLWLSMTYTTVQGRNNNPSTPATCHSHEIIAISKPQWFNQYLVDKCMYLDGCNELDTYNDKKRKFRKSSAALHFSRSRSCYTQLYL